MSQIRPKPLTPIIVEHDVDGFDVIGFDSGNAHVSGLIDRSLSPTFAELVKVSFRQGDSPTAPTGAVHIWVYSDFGEESAYWHPSFYPETPNAQVTTFQPEYHGLVYAGAIEFDGTNGYSRRFLSFNLAKLFGGIIPLRWMIVAHNATDSSLRGSGFRGGDGNDYWCAIQGYQAESI